MALTESKLRAIIREEAAAVMKEGGFDGEGYYSDDAGDEDDEYWDRDFDPDSDDEHDAIKDYAAMTGQSRDSVFRDRMAGRYGRRR